MARNSVRGGPALRQIHRKRWFQIGVCALILLGLILILLPYAIGYGTKRWLVSKGVDRAIIEDVDFNPFTGRLVVRDLRTVVAGKPLLHIQQATLEVDWLPLWRKRAFLNQLILNDTVVTIEETGERRWRLGGLSLKAEESAAPEPTQLGWGFGVGHIQIFNSQIHYIRAGLSTTIQVDRVDLDRTALWEPEKSSHLEFEGRVNDSKLRLNIEAFPFASVPKASAEVKLDGLSLSHFAALASPHLGALDGKLGLDLKIQAQRQSDTGLRVTQEGTVTLEQIHARRGEHDLVGEQLTWDGTLRLVMPQENGGPPSSFETTESGANTTLQTVDTPGKGSNVQQAATDSQGEGAQGKQALPLGLEVAGDFEGRGLGIDEGERDLRLVGLKSLVLEGISAKGKEQVTVSRMRLDSLHLLEPLGKKTEGEVKPSVLSLGGATLEQIDVRGSREFRISSVEFKDAIASLRRDPEGRWDLIDHVLAGRDTNQSAEQKETESPLVIAIGNVQILGDSQLNFDDEGVSPPYRTTLLLNEARIADIDSAKPEQLSPLTLIGQVGKYSRVALNGYLKPFTKRLSLHLTGKIQALDLPPLSPYVSRQLGYNLRSGRLDADIDLRVDLGELDASSKLLVNNLEVTPSDPDKFDKLTTQLTMPLPVALSMLRDKNRDIRLELPVTGDISSPKFDLSDAINKAVGKAMKFAALGFVKYVLQPYGAMITIAEWTVKGAKMGAAIRLDPVIFGPGSAALSETALEYLDKVSQLMADRPELRIKLCGLATEGDRMALGGTVVPAPSDQSRAKSSGEKKAEDAGTEPPAATAPPLIGDEQLEDLAKRRASTIMDYFIKEHGIEVERLFVCHPEVDTGEEAQSRVELLI